jgi:hypothetical protein
VLLLAAALDGTEAAAAALSLSSGCLSALLDILLPAARDWLLVAALDWGWVGLWREHNEDEAGAPTGTRIRLPCL